MVLLKKWRLPFFQSLGVIMNWEEKPCTILAKGCKVEL